MARPRASQKSKRRQTPSTEDFSQLSSEVLRLRLQALNLPISGSRARLLATLKGALSTTSTGRSNRNSLELVQRDQRRRRATIEKAQPHAPSVSSDSAPDEEKVSDGAPSLAELWDEPHEDGTQLPDGFTPAQRSAIQAIVSESVHSAVQSLRSPDSSNGSRTHLTLDHQGYHPR